MDEIRLPGMIHKTAQLSAGAVTDETLKQINRYTLEPLTAEQVFTFKAVLCDNEVDRDFERFSLKALQDLHKLFTGRTVIKNHTPDTDNQVARIYTTELVQTGKQLDCGEPYTQLIAHCYMVKTAGNADMIAEIIGGIRREGSVGCAVSGCICSICGTDNTKSYCSHFRGRSYDKENGKALCTYTFSGAKDAYEFSLVAVPTQRGAGISKSYTGETVYEKVHTQENTPADDTTEKKLVLRARLHRIKANQTNLKEEF